MNCSVRKNELHQSHATTAIPAKRITCFILLRVNVATMPKSALGSRDRQPSKLMDAQCRTRHYSATELFASCLCCLSDSDRVISGTVVSTYWQVQPSQVWLLLSPTVRSLTCILFLCVITFFVCRIQLCIHTLRAAG